MRDRLCIDSQSTPPPQQTTTPLPTGTLTSPAAAAVAAPAAAAAAASPHPVADCITPVTPHLPSSVQPSSDIIDMATATASATMPATSSSTTTTTTTTTNPSSTASSAAHKITFTDEQLRQVFDSLDTEKAGFIRKDAFLSVAKSSMKAREEVR